jgi:Peptidase M30
MRYFATLFRPLHKLKSIQYLTLVLVICLSACGGGGSSSSTGAAPTTFTPSAIVPDCTGAACAASPLPTPSYAGTGTGVWRFDNSSTNAVVGDVTIANVPAGKTVSLIYTNASDSNNASSAPYSGILSAPLLPGGPTINPTANLMFNEAASSREPHGQILHQNRQLALAMTQLMAPKANAVPADPSWNITPAPLPIVTLGDIRTWNENGFTKLDYATTAKRICPAGLLGRQVVIWVQTTAYPSVVTDAELNAYQTSFCGTNNNNGAYAKIANAIGDVWGAAVPSKYSATHIADTPSQKQDINIVILNPASSVSWGGYFYSLNNWLKSASSSSNGNSGALGSSTSNEALVFFVKAGQQQNYIQSVLIHELTHMINYYQRTVLKDDIYETWLEETTAMMTQDIFDPGLFVSNSFGSCLPIVCELQSYAKSGAGISYFNWPSGVNAISVNHYYMGGAFAAFLNRRYGPHIYLQLATDCYTPPANTAGYTCLDILIKNNGGTGLADELIQFGASVFGLIGGTGELAKYGFPAQTGSIILKTTNGAGAINTSFVYNIPAINNWWPNLSVPTAKPLNGFEYSSHTYQIDYLVQGKASYVRKGVSIPAKTTLSVVVK